MDRESNALELDCPSCGGGIPLTAADLVAGARVRCLHCDAEALVVEEFDERHGRKHWALDDTDDDSVPER